jgi:hypothetical protein
MASASFEDLGRQTKESAERLEKIIARMRVNNICFFVAPIGEVHTATRIRSDRILLELVQPAAEACGFRSLRADNISEPGIITHQVLEHLIEDAMVVADLTGRNANVFYELAVRHAIQRPYVQIVERGEGLPFDVAGVRTIEVPPEAIANTKDALICAMKTQQSLHPGEISSPISAGVGLSMLRNIGEFFTELKEAKLEMKTLGAILQQIRDRI